MSIVYLGISVGLHGLDLQTPDEAEVLRARIEAAIREVLPEPQFDRDITVEIDESAHTGPTTFQRQVEAHVHRGTRRE
jgi:hypothetical protein